MTTQDNGEWLNGLACTSAGLTRKRNRPIPAAQTVEPEAMTTETDEEIRAEFEAAARNQKRYTRTEETEPEILSYTSAGAKRRR
jgi:hypothetical protein